MMHLLVDFLLAINFLNSTTLFSSGVESGRWRTNSSCPRKVKWVDTLSLSTSRYEIHAVPCWGLNDNFSIFSHKHPTTTPWWTPEYISWPFESYTMTLWAIFLIVMVHLASHWYEPPNPLPHSLYCFLNVLKDLGPSKTHKFINIPKNSPLPPVHAWLLPNSSQTSAMDNWKRQI